ncbi:hypothetical protein FGG08_002127 [Glutinoglossum americanum]|uniref:Transmembrane protein n=1 Tax=Glutinoglossum americanum TaxID=1670608 RepID=A0A9P8L5U2_9PEZI|nr:hypothetical protein FGG08_002127 [Glutinoglossum americanum]
MASQVRELKAQGAEEASRDQSSNVTSEDAERKIVEESKKAGYQAYQFDPDATPEQKAAQARAHLPPGFHKDKKPTGVAVATDIDDGTPDQYDLPPPSKNGALVGMEAKQENGTLPDDENSRWVERTGWAPHFGNGGLLESENDASLLDQQTWIDSNLDDKFFGDWYHNAGVIAFACLSSWFVAVVGGGLGWIFIVMAFCATYYRTSIRRVRRNFRDDVNREMAKSRLETDVESLEWINSFLLKFWPIFQPILADTVINSVDQVLSTSTPAFLDSLRLKTFTLGSKPPRLEHVKTYPKAEDDIVLMDWKFSFTPNDTADMTARQIKNKINPKVVLEVRIGKAMVSKGLDVIVQDMAFSGLMRVKVKLQIPFPHVDRIEVCFLEKPAIDYVCKPLGGDTFGFDINFIPGLESFIMDQIHANIGPILYAPNVFPIEVAKMMAGNPVDQAIGVLAVTIHGAQGLKNPDKFSGTPDPYTVVSLNSRDELARTRTIKENASPRWGETKYVIISSLKDSLTLQIYDWNEYRKDRELGTATFALEHVEKEPEHENLRLEVMANGKPRGILQTDVRFFPVLEGRKLEDGKMESPPESNSGIARFTVEQAKDLDGTKSLIGQLNPYAVLLLNGKEVHISRKLKRTNNPIWDNGSKEILITDRKSARLGLVIKDDRDIATDPIIGTYQIKLNDMMEMMEKGKEWYSLAGAKTGRAKLTLQWKPVLLKGATGTGGYVTPIGVMRLHFQNARNLRNLETVGRSDPYVRVLVSGVEKAKTVTFQNNLNPDWDEVLYIPIHSAREKLVLEVMDQENVGKDRSLGETELPAADYVSEADNGEYLVHEERKLQSQLLRMHARGTPKGTLNFTASFYPCLNVAEPEEEEEAEKESEKGGEKEVDEAQETGGKGDKEGDEGGESENHANEELSKRLSENEKDQEETTEIQELPKLHLTLEELLRYGTNTPPSDVVLKTWKLIHSYVESGLLIFKIIEADLCQSGLYLDVVMDDMLFPSFVSAKATSKRHQFDEIGDAFVRELDFSNVTLRLRDEKGKEDSEYVIAKLTGSTLDTLKQCFNNPTVLILKGKDGGISKVKVSLKYIPVKMKLDASESINNMGTLRVDILDGQELPAADRSGKSDPYCKFELNGKDVYKTKTIKKTLNPVWNENFEVSIPSRTAAKFKVRVYDWDFGDSADFLGAADINLESLEPFIPKEYKLRLDGKSGTVRIRLLFKFAYVTRTRQGSSTFSGTFAAPTKLVTGVAGAPIKGVGMVGGGVVKGASFIKHGFKSKKKGEDSNGSAESDEFSSTDAIATPVATGTSEDNASANGSPSTNLAPPRTPTATPLHARSRSFGSHSLASLTGRPGTAGGPELGLATFTIISASGYPPTANVRVHIKQVTSKGAKDVHKTKAIKAPSGEVRWEHETFKLNCPADTQFQVQVKAHSTWGSDDDLGEALFFIDDSGLGAEKPVKAGSGSVVLRTNFAQSDATGSKNSPKSNGIRRGILSKKESPREGRAASPT